VGSTSQAERLCTNAMPRLSEHVPVCGYPLRRREPRKRLEEKILRSAPIGQSLDELHHGSHARLGSRNEGDKEVGEAEVRTVNAVSRNSQVRCEFLRNRGSIGVASINWFRPAVRLDSRKEKVAALAVRRPLYPERSCIRSDLI
jgi:hypothetical protein